MSNEHVMAALFAVIILYLMPHWLDKPAEIPAFLAVLALSLLLDAAAGFIRYKRPVCSVSAAVTAGVLQVITPGIPLWGRLIGIFAAIIIGKQVWGGTGRNTLNPAILGFLVICIIFSGSITQVVMSALMIPALVLSFPFIIFRPFAALGYFAGLLTIYITGGVVSPQNIIASGIFFGCIVLTDPVTVTPMKSTGLLGGFAAAFLPFYTGNPAMSLALVILIFNLASYLIGDYLREPREKRNHALFSIKSPYKTVDYSDNVLDLTAVSGIKQHEENNAGEPLKPGNSDDASGEFAAALEHGSLPGLLTPEAILERIRANDVYGMGGGAYPTADKITAVQSSDAKKKFFIINAAECDPGLVHDKWLLKNRREDIFKGIEIITQCIEFERICLAVKDISGLKCPDNVQICKVKDYYPAGYEKFLISDILDIKTPDGFIPAKEGILVLNVQTLTAVYEAVGLNKKADTKYITAADLYSGVAKTVRVKAGERILDKVEEIFPGKQPVFTGGGIMQAHMADDFEEIGRNTNYIAVSGLPRYKESPFCSNCGFCRANCPKGLSVNSIAELVDQDKFDETRKYHPEYCINCGLCSYVCLAGRNLSARVADAREKILL